jgi:Right handed beta helix region
MTKLKTFVQVMIASVIVMPTVIGISLQAVAAQTGSDPRTISWPSAEFRTLQAAIDATPEGGTLTILEGIYRTEPVYFSRKITIVGMGSGRGDGEPVTHLVGPPTRPVVDRDGRVILPSEAAVGVINILGAEIVLRDLKISRGDAGVVARNDGRGNAGPIVVQRCLLSNTGRGFLSQSNSDVTMTDTTIHDTQWHAIAVHPPAFGVKFKGFNLGLSKGFGAGMYFKNTVVVVFNDVIDGYLLGGVYVINSKGFINASKIKNNLGPGILWNGIAANGHAVIADNVIKDNRRAGIYALNWPNPCQIAPTANDPYPCFNTPVIQNNTIRDTQTQEPIGDFGDGIALQLVEAVFVNNNRMENNARAGLANWSSLSSLLNNVISANSFSLDGESFNNTPPNFINAGGNLCDGSPVCVAQGSGLQPPESVDPGP